MKYRRYGKFRFRDYTSAWLSIVFLFVLVVVGFLTDTQFYLLILGFYNKCWGQAMSLAPLS